MKIVKLESVSSDIDYGITESATDKNTGHKFLRITDIREGSIEWNDVPFCECSESDSEKYELHDGDIVFARTGSVGNTCIITNAPKGAVFASYLIRIRPNQKLLDPLYLSYFFQTQNYWRQIEAGAVGAILGGINASKLKELDIPLPPLPEQRRIAELLSRADRLRQVRAFNDSLIVSFIQSVFSEMFGDFKKYDKILFEELATKSKNSFANGPFGSNLLTTELVPKGVPVLYIRDISSGYYQRVSDAFVTAQKAQELDSCRADGGDILIAKVGDPPGTAAVYPVSEPTGIISQDVIRIKPNRKIIHPEFLVKFLNSEIGHNVLKPILVEGTRERFGLTPMKQLEVPIPPLAEQEQFAAVVQRVESLRARAGESARQGEELFQSLLAQSFGEKV
jgi:type I restriction enzyme S subunit